jgi:hypothetical protein
MALFYDGLYLRNVPYKEKGMIKSDMDNLLRNLNSN